MIALSMLACNLGKGAPAPGANAATPAPDASEAPTAERIAADSPSANGPCVNEFYPVVAGASWTYQFSDANLPGFTRSITAVNADGFNDQDVFASGITRKGEWQCKDGTLTALQTNGDLSASVQSDYVSGDFKTTSWDGITLPASPKAGDTWTQTFVLEGVETVAGTQFNAKNETALTCTAGTVESVTVPAGTFDALRVDCEIHTTITVTISGNDVQTPLSMTSTSWYAPNVGLVRTSNVTNGETISMDLTSYQIP
jgi:hypothetical protein